jgi:hypothetical protein
VVVKVELQQQEVLMLQEELLGEPRQVVDQPTVSLDVVVESPVFKLVCGDGGATNSRCIAQRKRVRNRCKAQG